MTSNSEKDIHSNVDCEPESDCNSKPEQSNLEPIQYNSEPVKLTEKVKVKFGDDEENSETNENIKENVKEDVKETDEHTATTKSKNTDNIDLSKYTMVDNLSEDKPIPGQLFCLFSFLSPEGVMNCNVRAVKFRGAYPTKKEALEAAKLLEQDDEYFKIFIGDTGKWLDFDPPASKVEEEMSSDPKYQAILDAQRKMRMNKINALAGKHMDNMDKKESGKKEVIEESKKAGAAVSVVEKQRNKKQEKAEKKEEKRQNVKPNARAVAAEKIKERMRKRLGKTQNKKALDSLDDKNEANNKKEDLDNKAKVIGKISSDIEEQQYKLSEADKNIQNIKQLLAKKKAEKK